MKNQQKNDTKWLGAGLGVAFIASLCCITPVLAILAGTSGIAATFSFMELFRPYLIGLTVLILGFAWYQKLRPTKEIDCECDPDESRFIQSKSFLGIVTVVVALLLAFPNYLQIFVQDINQRIIYINEKQVESVTFEIVGMTCAGCEASVKHAVKSVDGVLVASVSYKTKSALITYDKTKTDTETQIGAVNSTGFTAKNQRENQ
ncbi:MAG: mercuric transport protein MerTP [Balneolales bacterium]